MEKWEQTEENSTANPFIHSHFRALPLEAQRDAIRRLALRGLAVHEIAARTGWPLDRVRRFISEDDCVRLISMSGGIPATSRALRARSKPN